MTDLEREVRILRRQVELLLSAYDFGGACPPREYRLDDCDPGCRQCWVSYSRRKAEQEVSDASGS